MYAEMDSETESNWTPREKRFHESEPISIPRKTKSGRTSSAKWASQSEDDSDHVRSPSKSGRKSKKTSNDLVVKGPWREEEDDLLVELVNEFGARDWSGIASHIQGRIGKQCRERWFNHLSPEVRKEDWTVQEDKIIMESHQKLGNKWTAISKLLVGRPANAIKNHWNSTLRFKQLSDILGGTDRRRKRQRRVQPVRDIPSSVTSPEDGSGPEFDDDGDDEEDDDDDDDDLEEDDDDDEDSDEGDNVEYESHHNALHFEVPSSADSTPSTSPINMKPAPLATKNYGLYHSSLHLKDLLRFYHQVDVDSHASSQQVPAPQRTSSIGRPEDWSCPSSIDSQSLQEDLLFNLQPNYYETYPGSPLVEIESPTVFGSYGSYGVDVLDVDHL